MTQEKGGRNQDYFVIIRYLHNPGINIDPDFTPFVRIN